MEIKRKVLSDEEIQKCRASFQLVDRDQSGTIDVSELAQVLKEMGQRPS
eukprot:CAMPEP_0114315978 /NCGR_PEP_ID=MMETSP0059-20121206/22918_1 /TAXON_ID=36894 /ORGANISM="Pyramimonas parkeae, Strain CCMP726" /LENGTH=48 /DNA_ID= /DNA_START= /DNA_END= /DNA_ORIENTATION=